MTLGVLGGLVCSRPAAAEPILYRGEGDWVVVAGMPESAEPPGPQWRFLDGVWMGRAAADGQEVDWGSWRWPLADAPSLPLAPGILPVTRNPFGACVVQSLSVRFDSQIRSRRWSLVFEKEGEEPRFEPLPFPGGEAVDLAMELEDAVTGRKWVLRPSRQGREGSLLSPQRGDAVFYTGIVDEGQLEWTVLVSGPPGGRRTILGQVAAGRQAQTRLLRWRVLVKAGATGEALLQEESPPVVVAAGERRAIGLFADTSEPRRFRAVSPEPGTAGVEFDLAVTRATGNFPRHATISLEIDGWETAGAEVARTEAVARMARTGPGKPLPEGLEENGLGEMLVLEPSRMGLTHPGGFVDAADVRAYLMTKQSGIFPDPDWAGSAILCAAQDPAGEIRLERDGAGVALPINADPDLPTLLEIGRNRGVLVHERAVQSTAPAVWLKAMGGAPGLDHQPRALHLCDYPAVWDEETREPGVDLRHAEAELFAVVACSLKESGKCLLIGDSGPMAPYTTRHADALVCASADPAEMRRQRALAGDRPVMWVPEEEPAAAAEELAREFGFARPGKKRKD